MRNLIGHGVQSNENNRFPILFLSLVAFADPPTLVESAMIEYGFSEWPLTESTNLVSETWEPSLQWPLDPGAVVETNREHKSETEPTKPVGIKDK